MQVSGVDKVSAKRRECPISGDPITINSLQRTLLFTPFEQSNALWDRNVVTNLVSSIGRNKGPVQRCSTGSCRLLL